MHNHQVHGKVQQHHCLYLSLDYKCEGGQSSSLYLPLSLARVLQIRDAQNIFIRFNKLNVRLLIDILMERQHQQTRSCYYWQGFYGYIFKSHTERQAPNAINIGVVGTQVLLSINTECFL